MKSWLLLLRPESQAARLWLYSEKQTGSVLGREGETRICFLRNILQVITVCKRSKIFKFIFNVNLHYTPMLASWLLHHPRWQPPRSFSEVSWPHHHSFHVDIIGFNVSHFIIHQLFHPPPQVPHDVLHNVHGSYEDIREPPPDLVDSISNIKFSWKWSFPFNIDF